MLRTPPTFKQDAELSAYFTVILIFVTHGMVNALLMSGWNPTRCAFWNLKECSSDQEWMLNWLSLGHFQVFALLACLAVTARGNVVLEARLVYLCAAIMVCYLSNGIFLLDELNQPMAALQALVFVVLLTVTVYQAAAAPPIVGLLPAQFRSSSFDRRRKLAIPTAALFFQFLLAAVRVIDFTFGKGREGYTGDDSTIIFQDISHAAIGDMLWAALILGWAVLLATVEQHKVLLMGQAAALFVSQIMLTGKQGKWIEATQVRAAGIGTFFSILIALLGAL